MIQKSNAFSVQRSGTSDKQNGVQVLNHAPADPRPQKFASLKIGVGSDVNIERGTHEAAYIDSPTVMVK